MYCATVVNFKLHVQIENNLLGKLFLVKSSSSGPMSKNQDEKMNFQKSTLSYESTYSTSPELEKWIKMEEKQSHYFQPSLILSRGQL